MLIAFVTTTSEASRAAPFTRVMVSLGSSLAQYAPFSNCDVRARSVPSTFLISTVELAGAQTPSALDTVHWRVTVEPTPTPVTVVLYKFLFVITGVAAPIGVIETIDQTPVSSIRGWLAAIVNVELLYWV